MGVPAFYRWLSEKYPKVVVDVLEPRVGLSPDGQPEYPSKPLTSPHAFRCDNLYIDMNGIIHPCSHPENGPQPATEADMYLNVCRYVDRLVRVLQPQQLLFLAIDGVAPRAKMNQQRARRFRSAQEAKELRQLEDELRVTIDDAPPPKSNVWDSNVITPGTPFMLRLSDYLRFYIRKRLQSDWKHLQILFSDASIPGEGEHKLLQHVRLQRAQPHYNPNTVHCLHGLDADLIMLALATHEAHFYISREEVLFGRKSVEAQERRQMETGFKDAQQALNEAVGSEAMLLPDNQHKAIQRVSIPILREYLQAEFDETLRSLPFAASLEKVIDDFVFLCFFVGNDFLPHLPSLDIRDGALDFLLNVYKRLLPTMGDYLTRSGGHVNLGLVDIILAEVGAIEDHVFGMKHENEQRERQRREDQKAQRKRGSKADAPPLVRPAAQHARKGRSAKILDKNENDQVALQRAHQAKEDARHNLKAKHMLEDDNVRAAMILKQTLGMDVDEKKVQSDNAEKVESIAQPDESTTGQAGVAEEAKPSSASKEPTSGTKRKQGDDDTAAAKASSGLVGDDEFDADEDDADDDDEAEDEEENADAPKIEDTIEPVNPEAVKAFKEKVKARQQAQLDHYAANVEDKVRLHERGWKDRYYSDKCKADDVAAHGGREHLFRSYVVGLCWVMKYYYDGCCSWKWFYPFHYAPFASDLRNIERFENDVKALELSKPFNPVEQLMAVLPPDSAHAIPKASRWLMCDEESPIIDFYPQDVPVDPNGKAMPWLWVVLLPFIDEERLLGAMSSTMTKWTKEELLCNARGLDDGYLYVHKDHPMAEAMKAIVVDGTTAKAPKKRLKHTSSAGSHRTNGSGRPPLSNENLDIGDEIVVSPPSTAGSITEDDYEGLFAEKLTGNDSICIAFSQPLKLSHKSVLLPGARLPKPQLSADDKRIRRPRLNRGGGSIANMGVSNGKSHNSGYGSMNISNYERDLAAKMGRGNQMNQAGTRTWGSMEPTAKRGRHTGPPPPAVGNPFMRQGGGRGHPHAAQQPPPYQQQSWHAQPPPNGRGHPPHHQQYAQHPQYGQPQGYPGHGGPQYRGGAPPQGGYRGPPNHSRGPPPGRGGPPGRGYDFRAHNNNQGGGRGQPPASRTNPNVMDSLRAQLSSTLKQNRRPDQR